MFSRPVSSGWKPVPTSSSEPTRPRISAAALGRLGDPRQDLQQRALAGAVAADDADDLARRRTSKLTSRSAQNVRPGPSARPRCPSGTSANGRLGSARDASRASSCSALRAAADAVPLARGSSTRIASPVIDSVSDDVGEASSPSGGSRTRRRHEQQRRSRRRCAASIGPGASPCRAAPSGSPRRRRHRVQAVEPVGRPSSRASPRRWLAG